MTPPARGVLVTRPEPSAAETAARLAALGWRPVVAPVLRIVPRDFRAPGAVQAVLVTSGNAILALPASLRATPLWAVGDATAARARAAGFSAVHSADADAAALARQVVTICDPSAGPLLLASGAGQGHMLATALRSGGFRVHRRVAYAARPMAALPEGAAASLRGGEIGYVVVFSPETGRQLVRICRAMECDVRGVEALAISAAAASMLSPLPWRCVRVAPQMNQNALLGLLP